jgi:adenylate kinase
MLNIIIFGPPGSGKGTQSELIIEKYGLYHISTGEILRKEIENKSTIGLMAEEYLRQGQLVPDQLIMDILTDILDNNPKTKGFIFDGLPRTLHQGEFLDIILKSRENTIVAVFSLTVDENELIHRLLKRGEELGRNDDNQDTIKKRLQIYKEQTAPLIEYYKKKGKLFKINGSGTIEDIFENITEVLDRLSF